MRNKYKNVINSNFDKQLYQDVFTSYQNKFEAIQKNITFEKTDLDLTNETTLMLGMQQKLREFVDTELDYNYEFNSGIKI